MKANSNSLFLQLSLLGLFLMLVSSCQHEEKTVLVAEEEAQFVGSKSCMVCHQKEYNHWQGSHHDQAMKIADSSSVLGDFNNTQFKGSQSTSKFFKKGNDFFVNTKGGDGEYHDYKIEYTFGVKPLQQYLVQFSNGAYQCLLTAWDTQENKWFSLQNTPDVKGEEWMHWSGGSMTWNAMCADCHSTELKKNFDSQTGAYHTSFKEINVGCESCHGPASLHNTYYANEKKEGPAPSLFMDKSLSSKAVVDKCARCHSRRTQLTKHFDFKGHFLDGYTPSLLHFPVYELDGQIRDEDYVYGSFVQSKMYHNGVSCRDCHEVHSLKLKKEGNALCLSCHEPKYNTTVHHFHQDNTAATQCINCHMTGKTYMGNDFRRDHSFRVPRPDQSEKYGTPNACNGCHKNQSAAWASKVITKHFGTTRPDHFSDYLLAGSAGEMDAYFHLAKGKQYPEIARATALNQLATQSLSQNTIETIKPFLKDSASLIRYEAINFLTRIQAKNMASEIAPLLKDSIRSNRIMAAKYYHYLGLTPNDKTAFAQANKAYLEMMDMNADFASGQQDWAQYYQAKGDIEKAIQSYKKALKIDNYYNTSRMNLALLLYQKGEVAQAEKLYLKTIEQEPDFGYAYYMLGLLYNEQNKDQKALSFLAKACEKEPINIRAFYNYSLKLQAAKKYKKSLKIIEKALSYDPENQDFIYLKLLAQIKLNHNKLARQTCQKLIDLDPNNQQYQQLLQRLSN